MSDDFEFDSPLGNLRPVEGVPPEDTGGQEPTTTNFENVDVSFDEPFDGEGNLSPGYQLDENDNPVFVGYDDNYEAYDQYDDQGNLRPPPGADREGYNSDNIDATEEDPVLLSDNTDTGESQYLYDDPNAMGWDSEGGGSAGSRSLVGASLPAGNAGQSATSGLDPKNLRLSSISSKINGGIASAKSFLNSKGIAVGGSPAVNYKTSNFKGGTKTVEEDWRIKISVGQGSGILYEDPSNSLLKPLAPTLGVVFPYTPTISVQHSAGYQSQALTHSNYTNYFYNNSEVQAITIAGDFTVQNQAEGQYVMAAIQFFRSATKMFYGKSQNAGAPPPVLFLNGYGKLYFPHVPCVLTGFQHTMPQDVDYVSINVQNNKVRMPTNSQINITLQPVYSRKLIHDNFDFKTFAAGGLINKGFI
jgi:hypothetical protein